MAFDTIDINNLNIGSPFAGDALLFPNALTKTLRNPNNNHKVNSLY